MWLISNTLPPRTHSLIPKYIEYNNYQHISKDTLNALLCIVELGELVNQNLCIECTVHCYYPKSLPN